MKAEIEAFLSEQGINVWRLISPTDDGMTYNLRIKGLKSVYIHEYFQAESYEKALLGGLDCFLYHCLGGNWRKIIQIDNFMYGYFIISTRETLFKAFEYYKVLEMEVHDDSNT